MELRNSSVSPRLTTLGLVLVAGLFSAQGATAQEYSPGPGSEAGFLGTEWTLSAGIGAIFEPDYEGSDDYEWTFKPPVLAQWRDMLAVGYINGRYGAEATPFRFDTFSMSFGVAYWNGRDANDNPALTGLGDLDATLMGTATVANRFTFVDTRATLLYDFTGNRDGAAVEAEISAPVITSDTGVELVAGATTTWASGNYMSSTFGINATQAANSGYAAYSASSGFKDIGVNLMASYDVTDRVALTVRGEVKQLVGDAADSPIVDQQGDATQASVFGGISYKF